MGTVDIGSGLGFVQTATSIATVRRPHAPCPQASPATGAGARCAQGHELSEVLFVRRAGWWQLTGCMVPVMACAAGIGTLWGAYVDALT